MTKQSRTLSGFGGKKRVPRTGKFPSRSRKSTFELLEDRRVLATLTVGTIQDSLEFGSGQLTLREAIAIVNDQGFSELGLNAAEMAAINTSENGFGTS